MAQFRNRGTNVWQIGIYLGKDDGGKRITHYETFYGTKPQAREYGNDLEKELKRKVGSSDSVAFSIDDLFDKWLSSIKSSIENRTYTSYEYQSRRLRPFVGDLQLYTLTNFQLMERLKPLENEALSNRTIRDLHTTLRTALNWGAVFSLVRKDVMNGVKSPKLVHKVRSVFNPCELDLFIENAKKYKFYLVLRILALTGMRISEVLGITWANVDFENNIIKITQSADLKRRVAKETKTVNSLRELEMDAETMKELQLQKNKMESVTDWSLDDFVFQGEGGKPAKYSAIWKTKKAVLKKAKLRHARIHDFRHGMGSIMLDKGESAASAASTLGQLLPTFTAIYGHSMRKGKSIAHLLPSKMNSEFGPEGGHIN